MIKKYFVIVLLAIFGAGCNTPAPYYPTVDDTTGDNSSETKTYLRTGNYTDLTHNSVVLYAETNVDESKYESVEYGFLYSTSNNDLESRAGEPVWGQYGDRNEDVYYYSATLSDLIAEQRYYYCAMVRLNEDVYKYGTIKEFTTDIQPEDPNDLPLVESPGYGMVTIVLRAPEGTCNGMIAVGTATNWDGSDDWDPAAQEKKFTKINNTENWYQITLPANGGMTVKVIAISQYGIADWSTQWGMNVDGENPNVVLLEGEGYLDNSENGGEVKLTELVENTVVYVDVLAWESDPCVPKNEPGWATFRVTVPSNTPTNALVSVVGNFYENAWTPGAYVLTRQTDGTYYGEFDVPSAFEYKYVVGLPDVEWSWDYVEVGDNRQMPLDLYPHDIVEAWNMIPKSSNPEPTGWENGYAYVDLGLSVKWATYNVGATTPWSYGDYFAWGETQPKSYYDWSTYKWCNGSYDTQTKYCTSSSYGTVDDKTVLEAADDAATANWGGSWRMPTTEEQQELINNCTWTWTTQNGVNGHKVTSNKNGNSIFLPAAGGRYTSGLNYAGSDGIYWSSSLYTDSPYNAWGVNFDSSNVGRYYDYRGYGFSVRPVCQ